MALWFKKYTISDISWVIKDTMMEVLDMEFVEIGENTVSGRMPIGPKTIQTLKLLHGGASVALAETIGSVASYLIIDPEKFYCVGQSIYANHLNPGTKGYANALARPIRIGKTSHVWDIDITDDEGGLLCVCRLTMAIIKK
ncbi:MAG TPA: esterase [Flavobacteriales bacterium]|nr:esterase [Flavobacteriales bacterium]